MKKKIISAIALVSAVILTLGCATGCGKKGKTVDDIKKAGELVIATSPDFPPFEELKSNGAVEGIEIDIMNIICEKLGVTLKIEQMDFDSVLPGVQAGKYDVGVSGISVTEKRQKNTLFTDPYCLAAQAIVVTDGSSIKSKADLTGKTIARSRPVLPPRPTAWSRATPSTPTQLTTMLSRRSPRARSMHG